MSDTLLLLIQDDADVARGAALLRGELPVPPGLTTIQLLVQRLQTSYSETLTRNQQRVSSIRNLIVGQATKCIRQARRMTERHPLEYTNHDG